MKLARWTNWFAAAGCCLMLAGSAAQAQAEPREMRRLILRGPGWAHLNVVQQRGDSKPYWLGLECFPVDPALRSHLGLEEGAGLIIEHVVPDSPAEKAELKRHDVIVRAGDRQITAVSDLVQAVDEAEGEELSLEIIRGGKTITQNVTPAERPRPQAWAPRVADRPWEDIRRWMEGADRGALPGQFRYRIFGPGAVLPSEEKPLPKDTTVTITRSGGEPAKIKVQRGDEVWELNEEELDKLPEDLHPHVQRMLGRHAMAKPGMRAPPGLPAEGPREGAAQRQLQEMMDQMQKLQRQLEEFRHKLPPDDKPRPGETRA